MICELALVLALDVSGSISSAHYLEQRDATAAALEEVLRPSPDRPIALRATMWGDHVHVVVPWRRLGTVQDVAEFAQELRSTERPDGGSTNLTSALAEALDSFEHVPCATERRIVDISGDGASDEPDLDHQRQRAIDQEVQVNGLPIVTQWQPVDVVQHYRQEVITPDGFVVVAQGWPDYLRAMRRKLTLEIAGRLP